MSIQYYLQQASQELLSIADEPHLEAQLLLAHSLRVSRNYLYAWPEQTVRTEEAIQFTQLIARRLQGEPIAYLTGQREFWSLDLQVDRNTLIPRAETELLVEKILSMTSASPATTLAIADLGTGSGAIALALAHERPHWQLYATDINPAALHMAQQNAERHALTNITFSQGDWCAALPRHDFDMIVSNPPYITEMEWECYSSGLAFEPRQALLAGSEGLDALRAISAAAKSYLKPQGYLLMEHGYLQGSCVREMLENRGYSDVYSIKDLSGHDRVTLGTVSFACVQHIK